MRFDDKVVVITGASAGIGMHAAQMFADEGASVVLAARGAERLEAVAEEIRRIKGAEVLAVPTDVGDHAQCLALIDATIERFGRARTTRVGDGGDARVAGRAGDNAPSG